MATVLIVDDDEAMCDSSRQALSRDGHQVDIALSGEEALDKLSKRGYELVIADMRMPAMSGMYLLETIRRRWPDVNVIIMTGYPTIGRAIQAIKLGAFDYIAKPFTPDELRAVTARAL